MHRRHLALRQGAQEQYQRHDTADADRQQPEQIVIRHHQRLALDRAAERPQRRGGIAQRPPRRGKVGLQVDRVGVQRLVDPARMQIAALVLQRRDARERERSSDVARCAEQPGGIACLRWLDRRDRRLVEEYEAQDRADPAQQLRIGEGAAHRVRRQRRVEVAAHRHQQQAGRHRQPDVEMPDHDRHQRHHQQAGDAAQQHDLARLQRVIIRDRREELRDDVAAAVEHHPEHQAHRRDAAELAVKQQAQLYHRVLGDELTCNQHDEAEHGQRGQLDDERRLKPLFALPLFQHDREAAEPERQAGDTEPVGLQQLLQMRLLMRQTDEQQHEQHRTDRHVEEEGVMPADVFRQIAADQRPEYGAQNGGDAKQGGADRLLRSRQTGRDDRHRGGDQRAASDALPGAADDHHAERRRQAAHHRKAGEQDRRDQQESAQAQHPFQPGGERNDDDLGDEVGCGDPRALGPARTDLALNDGERRIDDRDVERRHQRAEAARRHRQPRAEECAGQSW
ncbi:hypothetical protein WR25_21605 [Diploscapter pachys]|uniref:Uncharacterized protein n=1 Tax=Diploscapter pachys TaxID=2018661 RepID=A0A2A2KKN5_9BILA|nr:hypothetical protein WR25_21605 [Diploscapter pachys]